MSRLRARVARLTARKSGLVVLGIVIGALFVPAGGAVAVNAAKEVFVTNTADSPVPTRAVGATEVRGAVAIADGAKVGLADGTTVKVDNADGAPVPVKVMDGGAGVQEPWSWTTSAQASSTQHYGYGEEYTVPAGKMLVITRASGAATSTIRRVRIRRIGCGGSTAAGDHAVISSTADSFPVWTIEGPTYGKAGCRLRPAFDHVTGQGSGSVDFNLFGYLVDE